MIGQNILEMSGIVKSFGGVKALTDGNLSVRQGEICALMGANGAGKSTLMNILGGVLQPDAGVIKLNGDTVSIQSAKDAMGHGIAFVHQELTTLNTMTVAENIFIDAFPGPGYRIDRAQMYERSAELLALVGCQVSPHQPTSSLSTGDRQLVEIARAMKAEPKIIILDEPTSSLSVPERQKLFELMASLKAMGASIIFISHFLEEVFTVCDRVTVMRDGHTVSTENVADTSRTKVVEQMLGSIHETDRIRQPNTHPGKVLVSVDRLDGGPLVNDISFEMHRGEILALWGLLGSGRTELVRAFTGLDPTNGGRIAYRETDGTTIPLKPFELRQRAGLVTEDRRAEGLVMPFSIAGNISLPNMKPLTGPFGLLQRRKENDMASAMVNRIGIKASSVTQPVGTLSGGNQQKVVFARWLNLLPEIYIFDEPTRGLDTGAKTEILKLIVQLAEDGAAILMISSELEELMRVADRYLIIKRGHIANTLPGSASQNDLMEAVSSRDNGEEAA
ncbi:sugar ABC transporter ATP-binding protein [Hoeflea prorocentri]|uniref:Sugar ABC transporter ATP-binding protein n=1 Tax=Hoeflea prorocentri TaxID=1922333 RepID=A0A9X3ZIL2_9HYPH|nr:sugar ABC transporter ATP-binding protein [Hoeflea prorocentri]MCY6383037.1 sugar ABC transporter ATP-binding protein [Hoeflea prorocentri]MDA5400837.1 sugar ABC transporter ATP-binding protein [Hoeflea prorocentri]